MAKAGNNDGDGAKRKAKKKPEARAYERPRGGEARSIADLVPEIGRTAFRKFGFIQSSVVSRWREIVGDRLADVTQPAMIRFPAGQKAGGTLHLTINGASLMMHDDLPEYTGGAMPPPSGVTLHLQVDDTDAWYDRAVAAGAAPHMPPADMFWGDRYAQVTDPFGHRWSIGTPVKGEK